MHMAVGVRVKSGLKDVAGSSACRVQGRDANRNLQRSLKAGRLRERLPAAVQQLAGAVAQWQDERCSAFMHDGRPLQVLLLQNSLRMQYPVHCPQACRLEEVRCDLPSGPRCNRRFLLDDLKVAFTTVIQIRVLSGCELQSMLPCRKS